VEGEIAPNRYWRQKTRVFGLPHGEDRMILSSFVREKYHNAANRQTEGFAELP